MEKHSEAKPKPLSAAFHVSPTKSIWLFPCLSSLLISFCSGRKRRVCRRYTALPRTLRTSSPGRFQLSYGCLPASRLDLLFPTFHPPLLHLHFWQSLFG
ncbi:hypothetical protein SLA2020_082610 [Shorea laevis]